MFFVVSAVCGCAHAACFVPVMFACVHMLWFCVCSVCEQGCVWPQPVLGSMGVPTGPKIRLSPRKAPDGARGMWERGLWGM